MHTHSDINARCQGKVLIKILLFIQDLALSQTASWRSGNGLVVKSPLAAEQQQCSFLQQHFQVSGSSAGQDEVLALLGMGSLQTLSSAEAWGEAELPSWLGGFVVCVTGRGRGGWLGVPFSSILSLASQSMAVWSRHS